MNRLIIGLTGHPGTGKSTAAAYLADKYGFKLFENSQAIKRDAVAAGVSLVLRKDYNDFYRQQQQRLGKDYLAQRVINSKEPRILQTGLRSRADFEALRRARGYVIALTCDPAVAVGRIDKNLSKNAQTIEQYLDQLKVDDSQDDYGTHTSWVVDHADYTVDTSGALAQTQAKLDQVMAEIMARSDQ